jgi:hypothetical protein
MTLKQIFVRGSGSTPGLWVDDDIGIGTAPSYLIASLLAVPITPGEQATQVTGYWVAGDQGGGTFVKTLIADAPGPVDNGIVFFSADAAYYWVRRFSNTIDARWFGSKGDGVTNDRSALQGCLDFIAVAGGGTLLIPEGFTFRCTDYLRLYSSNTRITGKGTIWFDCAVFTQVPGESTALYQCGLAIFRHLGNITKRTIITAADGVTSVAATRTLTSASSDFIAGGCLVGDQIIIAAGNDAGYYEVVAPIALHTLTVDRDWPTGGLAGVSFSEAQDPDDLSVLCTGGFIDNVTLEDVTLRGNGHYQHLIWNGLPMPLSNIPLNQSAIQVLNVTNFRMRNLHVEGFYTDAIDMWGVIGWEIKDCDFVDLGFNAVGGIMSRGLCSDNDADGVGQFYEGCGLDNDIIGNTVHYMAMGGILSGGSAAWYINGRQFIVNNTLIRDPDAAEGGGRGIICEDTDATCAYSKSIVIDDNIIVGPFWSAIRTNLAALFDGAVCIHNNKTRLHASADLAFSYGIDVERVGGQSGRHVSIKHNVLVFPDGHYDLAIQSGVGGPDTIVEDNDIEAPLGFTCAPAADKIGQAIYYYNATESNSLCAKNKVNGAVVEKNGILVATAQSVYDSRGVEHHTITVAAAAIDEIIGEYGQRVMFRAGVQFDVNNTAYLLTHTGAPVTITLNQMVKYVCFGYQVVAGVKHSLFRCDGVPL